MRRALAVLALLASAPAIAGCSFSFSAGSSSSLSADDVAESIVDELTPGLGEAPEEVTCSDDLPGEVDATITCVLTANGTEFDVDVTVTATDDDGADFDIDCADCVPALAPDEVALQIEDGLEAQVGQRPEISCPSGLAPRVGAELTCELVDGGETYDVVVTATSVDETGAKFSFQVADEPR